MSSPKPPPAPSPPQPDAPAAKALLGPEDGPVATAKKRNANRNALRFLTAPPTPGVGVNL